MNDIYGFPTANGFRFCKCVNCYRYTADSSGNSEPGSTGNVGRTMLGIATSPFMLYHGNRGARGYLASRNNYVQNIIRATTQQRFTSAQGVSAPGSPNGSRNDRHFSSGNSEQSDFRMLFLRVLELYTALERLCFPLPVNFSTKFVLLGFHTLSRKYGVVLS